MSVYTHKGKRMLTQNTGHVRAQIKDQFSSSFFVPIYLLSILSALFYGRRRLLLGGLPSRHEPNFSKPFLSFEKGKSQFGTDMQEKFFRNKILQVFNQNSLGWNTAMVFFWPRHSSAVDVVQQADSLSGLACARRVIGHEAQASSKMPFLSDLIHMHQHHRRWLENKLMLPHS